MLAETRHNRTHYMNFGMKYRSPGLVIPILFFITMSQMKMSYSRSALSSKHPDSNFSHYSTENHRGIRLGEFHERSIENGSEAVDHLKAIRANHYKRKVAFLEEELETCFSQIEKYHRTTTESNDHFTSIASTTRTVDSYISITPTSHGSSKVGKSTEAGELFISTTPNTQHRSPEAGKSTKTADSNVPATSSSHGSSKVVTYLKAESGNEDKVENHNVSLTELNKQLLKLNLVIFWRKEEELSEKEKRFLSFSNWDESVDIGFLLVSFKVTTIESLEEFYKSHMPKVIMYNDVADKMQASFEEDEIVHAHLLLRVMEELNVIRRRNETSPERMILPMPMDKLQQIITPRMVRWLLFLLFGQHTSLSTLRSAVERKPDLTLYEFCWSISKIWDRANGTELDDYYKGRHMAYSWMKMKIRQFLDLSWSVNGAVSMDSEEEGSSAGPFLRSMNLLLTKCRELLDGLPDRSMEY